MKKNQNIKYEQINILVYVNIFKIILKSQKKYNKNKFSFFQYEFCYR